MIIARKIQMPYFHNTSKEIQQVLVDTIGSRDALRHTQSSSCCAQSCDAECDRQATVVGQLLTTIGDDRRVVAKLFSVQRLEKSSRENYVYFWIYSNFVFV